MLELHVPLPPVPALALLALFYPLLLLLSEATQRLAGFGVPALGLLPLLGPALYLLLRPKSGDAVVEEE